MDTSELTPAQVEVLTHLRPRHEDRPHWPRHLRSELRVRLEEALDDVAGELDDTLVVTKRLLSGVHGCEVRHLAPDSFAWRVPLAVGSVVHKAVELSVHRRRSPTPTGLVEEAVASLTESDRSLGDWLRGISETERAELTALAIERVTRFVEGFPPLTPNWRPTVESTRRVELCDDRIVLHGRFDLTLGGPHGDQAGRAVVEIKSGGHAPDHLDDLRWYALLESLVNGVPPVRVATFYLASGRLEASPVDDNTLEAALRRTVEGIRRHRELVGGQRPPHYRPGPACRFCPLLADCEEGAAHLDEMH